MVKQNLFKQAIELKLIPAESVEKHFTVVQLEELIKKRATVVPEKLDLGIPSQDKDKIKVVDHKELYYKGLYDDLVEKINQEEMKKGEPVQKTLSNSANETVSDNVPDVVLMGVKQNNWRLLCKAFSKREGWMKSTKALDLASREVLVQTTTQQRNSDGSYSIADTLTVVSGRVIETEEIGIYTIVV